MEKEGGPRKVKIGLVQTAVGEDRTENLERTLRRVEAAAQRGAKIVCLQELFRSLYFPQQERADFASWAEPADGESARALSELARQREVAIIAPIFERGEDGKLYNTAVVLDADGRPLESYRKLHIPHDPLFWEKNYFEPGNKGYPVYRTRWGTFSVLICYDQWFPEAARMSALAGAEILFYPTAIGWIKGHRSSDGDWHDAWETVMRAHAIANGVHVAAVNRVGEEGKLRFWGSSFVCGPFGKVLRRASPTHEATLVVEVDLERNRSIQEGWGFLRNRRPDTYAPLAQGMPARS
ncbi:MAG: carbon-nitrogen hydrolase [Euryarchaeota archaeon]|nr:carbon-nitrogen hydrolase [Euryarchaeota archaeon]